MASNEDSRPSTVLRQSADGFQANFDKDIKKCLNLLDSKLTTLICDPDSMTSPSKDAGSLSAHLEFTKSKSEVFMFMKSLIEEMNESWKTQLAEMKDNFLKNVEILLVSTRLEDLSQMGNKKSSISSRIQKGQRESSSLITSPTSPYSLLNFHPIPQRLFTFSAYSPSEHSAPRNTLTAKRISGNKKSSSPSIIQKGKSSSLITSPTSPSSLLNTVSEQGALRNTLTAKGISGIMDTLLDAIKRKSENCVRRLLLSGVDPNLAGTDGTKPLLYAAKNEGCEKIINMLLQYDARPDYEVLKSACYRYNINIIEKLLKHGANPIRPVHTESALHFVITYTSNKDKSKICELFIKHGVEVDIENECYNTPLFFAIDCNILNNPNALGDVIETLLKYGAHPCYEHLRGSPLQRCFNLSPVIVENMVKYAALQVNHSDSQEMQTFFQNFTQKRNLGGEIKCGRKYLKFAQECMAEINTLKQSELEGNKVTLFNFAVSQGSTLKSFLQNTDVFIRMIRHLSFTPLPIYHDVIMRKIDRNSILSNALEASGRSKWKVTCGSKRVIFHTVILENIAKYLPKKDFCNLFVAFSFA